MSELIDVRGLSCPQPVIRTRAALQSSDTVIAVVDNETAQQNVTRMAERMGCVVRAEQGEDGIYLTIARQDAAPEVSVTPAASAPAGAPIVVVFSSEFMGRGDDELGYVLVRGLLHTLNEVQPLPNTLIFLNSGVKLVVTDSPVLDDLQSLQAHGVCILACGTCLNHYGLKERIGVGEISNMYDIAETMLQAGKVVNL